MSDAIILPPVPNFRDWPYSREELRARDLEVARLVLKLVDKHVADKAHKYDGDMEGADHDEFICADWAAGAMRQLRKELQSLEVKHHE